MRNIEQILADYELGDEAKAEIAKAVNENYRTINEVQSKSERIEKLESQVAEYEERIKTLDSDSQENEELKAKVAEYEQAEAERKRKEEEREGMEAFAKSFDEAVSKRKAGNEFSNPLIRDSVLSRVHEMCANNPAIGIEDAISTVTKDVDGVWANPQQKPHNMPTGKTVGDEDTDKMTMARFLFRGSNE